LRRRPLLKAALGATAFVQTERAKWKPIIATLGDLSTG